VQTQTEYDAHAQLNKGPATDIRVTPPPASPKPARSSDPVLLSGESTAVDAADRILLKDLDIPPRWDITDHVEVEQVLFGLTSYFFFTWKGNMSTGDASGETRRVALKWFQGWQEVLDSAESRKLLRQKFEAWLDLKHPNVLPFLGVIRPVERGPAPVFMVSPWMENGDLRQYLQRHPEPDKHGMALGIAKGLEYLHAQTPPVVHGDIRTSNVLVDSEGAPCLCDYGTLDLMADHGENTTSSLKWARWAAPERIDPSLDPHAGRTAPADMFSFGMLCYELVSGKPPFHGETVIHAMLHLIAGDRPELQPEWKLDSNLSMLCEVLQQCWQQDPTSRPSASVVVQKLTQEKSIPR